MHQPSRSIAVRVSRFNPLRDTQAYFEDFTIESTEPLSVMALLAKVHEADPTFVCRTSTCFKGKCGSCLVRINGEDAFGCTTLVGPGEAVTVEPHSKFKVIRDVVVDFAQPAAIKVREEQS